MTVVVRAAPGFAPIESTTEPGPVLGSLGVETHKSLLRTLHAQPPGAVTAVVAVLAPAGADTVVGLTVNWHVGTTRPDAWERVTETPATLSDPFRAGPLFASKR